MKALRFSGQCRQWKISKDGLITLFPCGLLLSSSRTALAVESWFTYQDPRRQLKRFHRIRLVSNNLSINVGAGENLLAAIQRSDKNAAVNRRAM